MVSVWYTIHMILIWMYNKVSFFYLGRLWWVEIALDYQMEVEVSRSSYWFWWYALHKELQKILFLPPFFIPPALCFTGSLEIKVICKHGLFSLHMILCKQNRHIKYKCFYPPAHQPSSFMSYWFTGDRVIYAFMFIKCKYVEETLPDEFPKMDVTNSCFSSHQLISPSLFLTSTKITEKNL